MSYSSRKGNVLKKPSGRDASSSLGGGGGAGEEEDAFDSASDDEATLQKLSSATRGLSIATSSASASAEAGSPVSQTPTSPPLPTSSTTSPTLQRATSSWSLSFNPFSIISGSSPKTTEPPPLPTQVLPGPEAVAAALTGAPPPTTSTPAVALKEAPKGKATTREKVGAVVNGTTKAKEESAPEMKRGKSWQMEQCKAAIKPDVQLIVKDPVSLLERLNACPPPPTNVPRAGPSGHRPSVSSITTSESHGTHNDDDEDDDTDPAAGYMQLGAQNLHSGAPQIVEFGKEEESVEDMGERAREKRRRQKFVDVLGSDNVDLAELRKLAWAGIPNELRPMAWQLLLGYLPAPSSRRLTTLARKRQEYADAVELAFSRGVKGLDGPIWHQISIDVPRTHPGIRLWQGAATQRSLEKILYVWAIRHPASGYVQGINDLVTPFFQVFLSSYITSDPQDYDVAALPESVLQALEADSFWCLSKLLDGIQDNYIFAQPGIHRQVGRMKELCSRVDAPLAYHLEENNVEFMQFAFRWMNCLLMREMSVTNIVRMWDTYLAEGADAFSEFHLYVCLAFLVKWSEPLRGMDFQSIIMFLQSLPTQDWTDKNTELLLSEAFMWSRTFEAR